MNGTGNEQDISAKSVPLYELIDKDGKAHPSLFQSAQDAAMVAKALWPDQEQDEDRTGNGWDVQVVGS